SLFNDPDDNRSARATGPECDRASAGPVRPLQREREGAREGCAVQRVPRGTRNAGAVQQQLQGPVNQVPFRDEAEDRAANSTTGGDEVSRPLTPEVRGRGVS